MDGGEAREGEGQKGSVNEMKKRKRRGKGREMEKAVGKELPEEDNEK